LQRQLAQRRAAGLLQEEASKAEKSLSATAAEGRAAQKELANLTSRAAYLKEKLQMVLREDSDLRATLDDARKGEAAYQDMNKKAQAAFEEKGQQLEDLKRRLNEVQEQYEQSATHANDTLRAENASEAKFNAFQNSSKATVAAAQQDLRATSLAATQKVRQLEDSRDNLTSELGRARRSLTEKNSEGARAKDTLVQETDAALQATSRAKELGSLLQDARDELQQNASRISRLGEAKGNLQAQLASAEDAARQRAAKAAEWQAKAASLEQSAQQQAGEGKKTAKMLRENQRLRQEISELEVSGEGQRVEELKEELESLREDANKNASRFTRLYQQMIRLRELKEGYGAKYETEKNASDMFQAKTQDLTQKLQAASREMEMLQRTQERAMEREQSARSEEEEYSTENTQLQSQDEQLTQQVKGQTAEATQSQAEVEALREQVKELKSSRAMHERSSHAAWVANERELIQARRDLQLAQALHQNLKTELSQMTRSGMPNFFKSMWRDVQTFGRSCVTKKSVEPQS